MKKYLLYIFILQIIKILSNYTYEIIDEMIPRIVTFDKYDFDSFKIFRYKPLCKGEINPIKQVYLQITNENTMYLYTYENYSDIEQDEDANFINYKKKYNLFGFESKSYLLDLNCGKDYYFIISIANKIPIYYYSYFQFLIVDADDDIIKLNPSISDILFIEQRQNRNHEILYYIHNETKYGLLSYGYEAKVEIYKNGSIIFNKTSEERNYENIIKFEKNYNYTIYFEKVAEFASFIIQLYNESKIFKHNFQNGPILL